MDYLERFLGVAPDGGSGAVEIGLILVLAGIVGLVVLRRMRGASPYASSRYFCSFV